MRFLAASAFVALAAAMVIGVAGATTNIVPNGTFEAQCTGGAPPHAVPCDWHASAGADVYYDISTHHGGVASMKVDSKIQDTGSGSSTCVSVAPGLHDVSYWYNNSDPNIQATSTRLEIVLLSGCGTFVTSYELYGTGTGGWLQATGTFYVPATADSVFFTLYTSCLPSGACSGYFDDLDFEAEVLAVTLSSFTAARAAKGVSVRWRTGTEADTLGFHVFRSRAARWKRVDDRLIRAKGSVAGARYSFLDRRAPRGKLTYRLQVVGTDGSRSWYGRAIVAR